MTTREPGASDVLTAGLTFSPRSTAFLASRAAPSMTLGLLVLVQLVMAAMRTLPCPICVSARRYAEARKAGLSGVGRFWINSASFFGKPS